MIHYDYSDPRLPDAGQGMCCIGAAEFGPGRCTCWEPVCDVEQQPVKQGAPAIRDSMCGDCAFRKSSPEQSGDKRYAHSGDGELEDIVSRSSFFCHQGMRKKISLVHPSGARVEIDTDAYVTPYEIGGTAHKADGSPADLCAGWWAARRKELSR